jgi:hypothetical protein
VLGAVFFMVIIPLALLDEKSAELFILTYENAIKGM